MSNKKKDVLRLLADREQALEDAENGLAEAHRLLGEYLRGARERSGVSLRSLAVRSGCSAAFLSDVERGHRRLSEEMRVRVFVALATFYNAL